MYVTDIIYYNDELESILMLLGTVLAICRYCLVNRRNQNMHFRAALKRLVGMPLEAWNQLTQ